MNKQKYFKILLCSSSIAFLTISATLADTTTTVKEVIRNDVFAATSPEEFQAAYSKSSTSSDKIAVLNALSMAINRFHVNPQGVTVPSWLETLLARALQDRDPTVVQSAVEQINSNQIICFSDALISLYDNMKFAATGNSITLLRTSIIEALGTLGTPDAINLFGYIIDSHSVGPDVNAAFNAVGASCAIKLVPNINSYVNDIQNRIKNKSMMTNDSPQTNFISPESALQCAYGTIQLLGSNACGK